MLASLILFYYSMQMICNHVLYQNDAACFGLPQQLSHYHSDFSIVAAGDPSQSPYRCVMGEVSV